MASEPILDQANCAELLKTNQASFLDNSENGSVPLNNQHEVRIAWEFSTDENFAELERYLREYTWPTNSTPRRFVNSPVIHGEELPGLWRQAFITRVERTGRDGLAFLLVLTLRKGWAEELSWTEALILDRTDSDGNTEDVEGNDDTDSYNDASDVTVRFPNVSPYKISVIMAQLAAATYASPTVQDQVLTGTWHKAFLTAGKLDDGSAFIDLKLSRQRFTVSLYENYSTTREALIYKLFSVTKDVAQSIVDDWQAEGRSADIQYSESTKLCTVVLRDRGAPKDNMSTSWIKDGCDQYFRQHMAWGYTKEELEAWVKVHDGQLNDPAVEGDEGADTQPITRRLSISERGDGLFNAIIEERKFDNNTPTAPDYTITLPVGTKRTVQKDYGWNFKSSEISADAIKQLYDTTVAAVGTSVDFQVTREDDCSFDYVAQIVVVTAHEDTLEADDDDAGHGIRTKALAGRGLTTADLDSLESSLVGGARKRHQVRLDLNDDETADYTVIESEVQKAQDTLSSGSDGEAVTAFSGRNVDAADLDAIATLASGIRKGVRISLDCNDDGTFNYGATLVERQEVEETAYSYDDAGNGTTLSEDDGVGIKIHTGRNVDPGDLQTVIADLSAARVRLQVGLTSNDDGSLNYTVEETHVQEAEHTINSGTSGIGVTVYAGKNMDAADITGLTSAARQRVSLQLSPNDDGTYDWTGVKQTLQKAQGALDAGASGEVVTAFSGRNVDAADLAGVANLVSDIRKNARISLDCNDDGTFNYSATLVEPQEVEESATSGTDGIGIYAYTGNNVDPGDLQAIITGMSGARIRLNISLSANDDGSINYSVTKQSLQKAQGALDAGSGGEVVTAFSGRNVDAADLAGVANLVSDIRKNARISLDCNDDGTFNYSATLVEPQEVEESATSGTDGIGIYAYTGNNVDPGDLQAIITGMSGARIRLNISLSANDDGSINYSVTKQSLQKAQGALDAGSEGEVVTAFSGRNVDAADLASVADLVSDARKNVRISLDSNDDGTFNYSATLVEPVETTSSHGTTGTDGIAHTLYFGGNADIANLPEITSDFKKRHRISVSAKNDGTVDYAIDEQTVDDMEDNWSFTPAGAFGIGKVIYAGTNKQVSDLDTVIAAFAPSELIDYDLSVSGNNDGTINYIVRKVTKVASEQAYNIGSIGNNVDLSVGKNLNTLADPGHPVAKGVSIDLNVEFDDAGGIRYIKRTNTKSEQDSGAVKGGTYTEAVQKDYRTGDVDNDDFDASAEVVEGVSVDWNVQVQQDGSTIWAKVTRTAAERSVSTLYLSDLLPSLDKFGYVDQAVIFKRVPAANIGNYLIFTGGVHGYTDSLQFHDDGTISGRAVTRTYKAAASTNHTDVSITWPSSTTATILELVNKYHTVGGKTYLFTTTITWTYSWLVSASWGAIDGFLNNSYNRFSVTKIDIYGKSFWFAVKLTSPIYGVWSKAIATALEDV